RGTRRGNLPGAPAPTGTRPPQGATRNSERPTLPRLPRRGYSAGRVAAARLRRYRLFQSSAKPLVQLGDPRLRGVLVTAVLATLALILVLSALVGTGIDALGTTGIGWLDGVLGLVGALGTVVLLVLLFPGMVQLISGLF